MIPNEISECNIHNEVNELLNESVLHESILKENFLPHLSIESLMGNPSLLKRQIFDWIYSVWSTADLYKEEPFDEKSLPLDIIRTDKKLKDECTNFHDFIMCQSNGTAYPHNNSLPQYPDSYDIELMRKIELLLHEHCSRQYFTECGKFKSTVKETFVISKTNLKTINEKCSEIFDYLINECAGWSLAQFVKI